MINQNGFGNQQFGWNGSVQQYGQPNYPNFNVQPVAQAPKMIPGRIVKNPSEIRPNEVPMDGGISCFPTEDMKYIYVKQWNSDGTIFTAKYERTNDIPTEEAQKPSFEQAIMERLDNIEKMLTKKTPTAKKGADVNE